MAKASIQEQFGERVISSFTQFARADLRTPRALELNEFRHVADLSLRRELARVHYGVRWLYKLGLALLAEDVERAAHVRAQVVDYASVCEGLIGHFVGHAIRKDYTVGNAHEWSDPDKKQRPLEWKPKTMDRTLGRQSFWWLIRIAHEFKIVDEGLTANLHWLREQRNTVHLRQRVEVGHSAFLSQSMKAFGVVGATIGQTKAWKATHP